MNRLQQMFQQIGKQLGLLTVSQRLAIGLCAALIAASLVSLLHWTTTPEMVAVFDKEYQWNQLKEAESALLAGGVKYQARGRRLFVRMADRNNAIRLLHESDVIPDDGTFNIEDLIKNSSPFKPESDKAFERNVAWGNKLAAIIVTSPMVTRAAVMINPTTRRRVGFKGGVPTASVNVVLRQGQSMTPEVVRGLASLVSRAVADLEAHNVDVIDGTTLRKYSVPAPGEADAAGFLDEIKKHEQHLLAKVTESLAYIPNVIANVSVELETSRTTIEKQAWDKPKPKVEDSSSSRTETAQAPSEPGVNANLGIGQEAVAGGDASSTEESKTEFFDQKLIEKTVVQQIAPARRRVTASIMIPRSWIVRVFQINQPDVASPTDEEMKDVRSIELQKIADSVAKTILTDANDVAKDVTVDVYPDLDIQGKPLAVGALAAALEVPDTAAMDMAKTYGPQLGLGLLALFSLMMMMRVVRKSADLVAAADKNLYSDPDSDADEDAELGVSDGAVGRAALSSGFLEGQELSEEEMRFRELTEQVSNLVESDPAAVGELLVAWIKEDE